jgi:hypothetical protein
MTRIILDEPFVSVSEEHKEHSSEASAILFQVFLCFVKMYLHNDKGLHQEAAIALGKLVPAFADYASRMVKVKGKEATRKLLIEMYEDAGKTINTSIRSMHKDPRLASYKKRVELDNANAHQSAIDGIISYGEEFIDEILNGADASVSKIRRSMKAIAQSPKHLTAGK